MTELKTDVLIVGGGMGGCAAAMAVTSMGLKVILTEPTDWLGGQLTSQAVPPDEHPWIETCGRTARYQRFRTGVRDYYRQHYPLNEDARADALLNPGGGAVSGLCHEPRVALAVIDQMLGFARASGALRVLLRHEPIEVGTDRDSVRAVTLRDLDTGRTVTVHASCVLDATELGDLLPMAGVEYVKGAESRKMTGELHALDGPAKPDHVQALTWCFPMGFDPAPQADHVIERPRDYDKWRAYTPDMDPPWSGPLLSWDAIHAITLKKRTFTLFGDESLRDFSSLWHYRRVISSRLYDRAVSPNEVTLVNWPQNDYLEGSIIDRPREEVQQHLDNARQLSLSLMYWMQTEAPRPDGEQGYPGLYMCPELVGTNDGLAKAPYVRESRRIESVFTVTEQHVGCEARQGAPAETFTDTVGVGYYRIDLHPNTGGRNYVDIDSMPYQIPLGALLPVRVDGLIPACKNIGTTHITNGCFRLHPTEWNIGESAGVLAAYCVQNRMPPRAVRADAGRLEEYQSLLAQQGVELAWPEQIIRERPIDYRHTDWKDCELKMMQTYTHSQPGHGAKW
jgi:FAD-dependent oxidoreductase family protein